MPESHDKPGVQWLGEGHEPPVITDEEQRLPRYAELHCLSNFSFQRGASHPQELVWRAWDLGYDALALTDECSVAGVVRAWSGLNDYRAWVRQLEQQSPDLKRWRDFRLLYGSEFDFGDARLVALARDLPSWGDLCEFISAARMHAPKGSYEVGWHSSDLGLLARCELIFLPRRESGESCDLDALVARLTQLAARFGDHLWLGVEMPSLRDDELWLAALREAGRRSGVRCVAAGNVHMHVRGRKPLQDVISAVRLGRPVSECGQALQANAERHLRQRVRLHALYGSDLLDATLEVAARCAFDLRSVREAYEFPPETVPEGMTPIEALRHFTQQGVRAKFPEGLRDDLARNLEKELLLIESCRYEMFFLTVHDIVRFAESRRILCQGRGSAANSIVCYCLGITAADPRHSHPLLERFISEERRNEPPDIDVDFEHERREEVIQYIYGKYGRERAAIAAVVIGYRTRSAIRDVGMALGVPEALIDAFAKEHFWFDDALAVDRLGEMARLTGTSLARHTAALWIELTDKLRGFPRHLSQHVGGFVLTRSRLTRLVPVENAAMADRSIIQWDKDDLEDMGLLKVDVLALGMLTALRRCLDLRAQVRGTPLALREIPQEDAATYAMIRRADTVGVFQIESRAQMSMLPRLKPRTFYDLVVEVAIVRPGPIEGGMVHPYLQARERVAARRPIHYEKTREERSQGRPSRLEKALARTLGVPIFQEQVMEIAMLAADFTGAEADALRRSMAAWKRKGGVERFRARLIDGMLRNGYEPEYAERIFSQMLGFGEYGFPESHAYSFALLAYASSWLKCHEPDCFLAAMLNSQPMGFYSPSQLIQDARRHGIEVLPPDVASSDWDCMLGRADEALRQAQGERGGVRAVPPCVQPESNSVQPAPTSVRAEPTSVRAEPPSVRAEPNSVRAEPNSVRAEPPSVRAEPVEALRQAQGERGEIRAVPASVQPEPPPSVQPEPPPSAQPEPPSAQPEPPSVRAEPPSVRAEPVEAPGAPRPPPARALHPVRLGLRLVAGFNAAAADRIVRARAQAPFVDVEDLALRARLEPTEMQALASADALRSLAGHRRQQVWQASAHKRPSRLLADAPLHEAALELPAAREGEEIVFDYASLGFTLRRHPLELLRPRLARMDLKTASQLQALPNGRAAAACGIVTVRQQPQTAKGTIFVTLEDETGPVNVIVWKSVREAQREALLRSRLLAVHGTWQRDEASGRVCHLVATRLTDLTPLLGRLAKQGNASRDFH